MSTGIRGKRGKPVGSDNTSAGIRSVFGLNVAALARDEAVSLLELNIREQIPVKLAFVNANLANVAYKDTQLHGLLRGFLLLNDGSGLNIASRMLYGKPFPDNLNGTDFTPYFLDHCGAPLNIFLLGARPQVVARAAEVIAQRWPQHNLTGYHDGYFSEAEEGRVIEMIREAKPNLLLVAMGNGLQERWIDRLVPEVSLSAWGIGALFDFLAGEVRRAPLWMRYFGIEWVYRLILEPRRLWRRYVLGNPLFVMRVLRELISTPRG